MIMFLTWFNMNEENCSASEPGPEGGVSLLLSGLSVFAEEDQASCLGSSEGSGSASVVDWANFARSSMGGGDSIYTSKVSIYE